MPQDTGHTAHGDGACRMMYAAWRMGHAACCMTYAAWRVLHDVCRMARVAWRVLHDVCRMARSAGLEVHNLRVISGPARCLPSREIRDSPSYVRS